MNRTNLTARVSAPESDCAAVINRCAIEAEVVELAPALDSVPWDTLQRTPIESRMTALLWVLGLAEAQ